ncbi:zinc ribbon domain-containing protein [Butyrivibrio sp. AD3002]|uniref:zinc ribbon domain-containing protein n=1 Tax=Butyrivibrio sp. AD3002 TaxID=1280670 RepID=UPI0003B42E11|nr:zinc ribbon domain-containing protein [Butyrivibrio sp. AD3002]
MICPNCKENIPDNSVFCPKCGCKIDGNVTGPIIEIGRNNTSQQNRNGFPKVALILCAIVVLAVIAIIIIKSKKISSPLKEEGDYPATAHEITAEYTDEEAPEPARSGESTNEAASLKDTAAPSDDTPSVGTHSDDTHSKITIDASSSLSEDYNGKYVGTVVIDGADSDNPIMMTLDVKPGTYEYDDICGTISIERSGVGTYSYDLYYGGADIEGNLKYDTTFHFYQDNAPLFIGAYTESSTHKIDYLILTDDYKGYYTIAVLSIQNNAAPPIEYNEYGNPKISGSWTAVNGTWENCECYIREVDDNVCDFVVHATQGTQGIMLVVRAKWEEDFQGDLYAYKDGVLYYYDYEKQEYDKNKTLTGQSGYFAYDLSSLKWSYDNFDGNSGIVYFSRSDISNEYLEVLMPDK